MKIFVNMKKRLLWCGFAFAVVLLILMISTENNIIQRIPFLDVSAINDIRCYDETSSADGIYDFNPESSKMAIIIAWLFFPCIKNSRKQIHNLWALHLKYVISDTYRY